MSPEYMTVTIGLYRIEAHANEVMLDQRGNTVSMIECALWKNADVPKQHANSNFVEIMSYEDTTVPDAIIRFIRHCLRKYDLSNENNPYKR